MSIFFGALNAGASGFLLKRTSPEELIAGIHIVAVGDSLLSPSVTRRVIDRMAQQPAARQPYDERLGELTPREREVLAQVARGLSNSEIAEELVIEESTVKTHVKRILMKLRLRDRVQAVIFAYESGLTRAGSGDYPLSLMTRARHLIAINDKHRYIRRRLCKPGSMVVRGGQNTHCNTIPLAHMPCNDEAVNDDCPRTTVDRILASRLVLPVELQRFLGKHRRQYDRCAELADLPAKSGNAAQVLADQNNEAANAGFEKRERFSTL